MGVVSETRHRSKGKPQDVNGCLSRLVLANCAKVTSWSILVEALGTRCAVGSSKMCQANLEEGRRREGFEAKLEKLLHCDREVLKTLCALPVI